MGSEETVIPFIKKRNSEILDNFKISYGDNFKNRANEIKKLIEQGHSNFAFMTDYYYYSQQKFILTLCLYLSNQFDFKFTIYSQGIEKSFYKNLLVRDAKRNSSGKLKRVNKITDKFYLIDIENFTDRSEEYLNLLKEPGTIQLWDLPPCELIQSDIEHYHKFINKLDHVSIISDRDSTSHKEMRNLQNYFAQNKVNFQHDLFTGKKDSKMKNIFKQIFDRMIS